MDDAINDTETMISVVRVIGLTLELLPDPRHRRGGLNQSRTVPVGAAQQFRNIDLSKTRVYLKMYSLILGVDRVSSSS